MNPSPSARVLDLAARDNLGLAPHYLTLWSAVVGLEARRVLEFGAGGSTAVILDAISALGPTPEGRVLFSCSTESAEQIEERFGPVPDDALWVHRRGLSSAFASSNPCDGPLLDLILHDGSHAADVVEADLRWALPRLRQFGLCLVHDSQHSYVGVEVRKALHATLTDPPHDLAGDGVLALSCTTLPYGFGLTILRRESAWAGQDPIRLTRTKVGSSHQTEPMCL